MGKRAHERPPGRLALATAAALAALAPGYDAARADRYEATIAVRPAGGLARIAETGADEPATVVGAGGRAGLSYGLRNWLDLGGELAAIATTQARYEMATADVGGTPRTGALERTTRLAQLTGGATLRLGVAWVPTIHAGLGIGARQRSSATLDVAGAPLAPDDRAAALTLDVIATARLGLERRLTPRWMIGVSAGVTQCLGVGAPDLQLFDASLTVAYMWYPLW